MYICLAQIKKYYKMTKYGSQVSARCNNQGKNLSPMHSLWVLVQFILASSPVIRAREMLGFLQQLSCQFSYR